MKLTRLTIREYAESLAVAFILAMIIRHFVVEAFRIPTSSMEPTLIGSETHGDRILVSKFEFDLHPPEQFDIVVFKIDEHRIGYWRPSDTSQDPTARHRPNGTIERDGSANYINYVKRLVALPGQTLQVKNGDLFIDGTVCRKPRNVEDALLVPVTNDKILKQNKHALLDRWTSNSSEAVGMNGDVLRLNGTLAAQECSLSYDRYVQDRVATDAETTRAREARGRLNIVGDLRIAFRFTHKNGTGRIVARLREDGVRYGFYLPSGGPGERARLLINGREVARSEKPVDLGEGEHEFEASNIDSRLTLRVDGRELIVYEDQEPARTVANKVPVTKPHASGVQFGAISCDLAVRDVRLWRDIYYTSDPSHQSFAVAKPLTLGNDEYFMMGDNSSNSFDGRNWGVVKQSSLIGEAFFVFWPIPRWKFIN
jgi:signal peptidase I